MKLSKEELVRILDIEPPFLMIDEAVEVVPLQSAHAIKRIDADEWFMQCHLRASPVMPGALQAEAMLQTFVLQIYLDGGNAGQHSFVRQFDTTLLRKVTPADAGGVLHVRAAITDSRRGIVKGNATLTLNDEPVARANITMVSPAAMPVPVPVKDEA